MNAYHTSSKLKLGLILSAVLIAVASLWYTNDLANRLLRQEREAIQLWARAIEYQAQVEVENPYQEQFARMELLLGEIARLPAAPASVDSLRRALRWARAMPPSDEINFVFNEIVQPERFNVPAIITDTLMTRVGPSRNVSVDSTRSREEIEAHLLREAVRMDAIHPPIRLELGDGLDVQLIHYGESETVRSLRWFPF